MLLAVSEQFSGHVAGWLAIFECHLAVDQDLPIAFGPPDPAPLSSWKIICDFHCPNIELIQIINNDVRRSSLAQRTPVLDPAHSAGCVLRRQWAASRLMISWSRTFIRY